MVFGNFVIFQWLFSPLVIAIVTLGLWHFSNCLDGIEHWLQPPVEELQVHSNVVGAFRLEFCQILGQNRQYHLLIINIIIYFLKKYHLAI